MAHVDVAYIDSQASRAIEGMFEVACFWPKHSNGLSGTVEPEVILNTYPTEPSILPASPQAAPQFSQPEEEDQPAPRKKLVRRVGSRAGSRAPSVPPEPQVQAEEIPEDVPKPRKVSFVNDPREIFLSM